MRALLNILTARRPLRPPARLARPQLMALEDRALPAVAVGVDAATKELRITGDQADNNVTVRLVRTSLINLEYRVLVQGAATRTFGFAAFTKIHFQGGSGNDTFTNQTILPARAFGQAGNDRLTVGVNVSASYPANLIPVGNFLDGGDGNDTLIGSSFQDNLVGGAGNDTINAGAGDDIMNGADGKDTINAGAGHDIVFAGAGNDNVSGGDGRDSLFGAAGGDVLRGGADNDVLSGNEGGDTLYGDDGNDDLTGGLHNDFLDGGDGNDIVRGGVGNDALFGGEGDDALLGEAGDDMAWGGDDDDQIDGGDGDDQLHGEAGNDILRGRAGLDLLFGREGNDDLDGGADLFRDTLDGGFGADTYHNGSLFIGNVLVNPDGMLGFDADDGDELAPFA